MVLQSGLLERKKVENEEEENQPKKQKKSREKLFRQGRKTSFFPEKCRKNEKRATLIAMNCWVQNRKKAFISQIFGRNNSSD